MDEKTKADVALWTDLKRLVDDIGRSHDLIDRRRVNSPVSPKLEKALNRLATARSTVRDMIDAYRLKAELEDRKRAAREADQAGRPVPLRPTLPL